MTSSLRIVLEAPRVRIPGREHDRGGLDLVVEPGRRTVLLGRSGAGKSLLARIALGRLPLPPVGAEGRAVVEEGTNRHETDLATWPPGSQIPFLRALRGDRISFVPQGGRDNLVPGWTVLDHLRVVREQEGLCYDAGAHFDRAKGLLVVQLGVDPQDERRARRRVLELQREVARGQLDPEAHAAFLEERHGYVEMLADVRGALLGWFQMAHALRLPLDPREHLPVLASVTARDVRRVGARLRLDAMVSLRPPGGGA